ncbi:MAG: hypothetical protein JWM95_1441 [Gemmatimonadetes bacterium]|nr:hypothetical protein [Gemmatimonadota bacterium]
MSFIAQVWHVMRKDARQVRVLLLVYVAAVAASAEHAIAPTDINPLLEMVVLLLFVLGMLVAAGLVQADSPTRNDAFWRTRPLRPMAVLAAKVVTIIVAVLLLAAVAQAMVLTILAVPFRAAVPLVGNSARIYATWLLVAVIVASATRDLRTFVVTLMAGAFATLVSISLIGAPKFQLALSHVELPLRLLGAAGGIIFVVHLYRGHDITRRTLLCGVFPVIALLLPMFAAAPGTPESELAGTSTAHLKLDLEAGSTPVRPEVRIRVEGAEAGKRYRIRSGVVVFHQHGKDTLQIKLPEELVELDRDSVVNFPIGDASRLQAPVDSIVLTGTLIVEAMASGDTLRYRQFSTAARDGRRVTITKVAPFFDDALLVLTTTRVEEGSTPVANGGAGDDGASTARLVNTVLHESIPLHRMRGGTSSRSILLSGVSLSESSDTYKAGPLDRFSRGRTVDAAWLKDAYVELTRWVLEHKYPVHDTVVLK